MQLEMDGSKEGHVIEPVDYTDSWSHYADIVKVAHSLKTDPGQQQQQQFSSKSN